jgi:uncharacterized protein YkwD
MAAMHRCAFMYAVVGIPGLILLGCGAAVQVPYAASNSTKMAEAAGFAGAAAAAQVVESAMEASARNNAPVGHSGAGLRATTPCDDVAQYPCVSVSRGADPEERAESPAEREMTVEEARSYAIAYVNGVRELNGVSPVAPDPSIEAFAQAGSEELSLDHHASKHMIDHGGELGLHHDEVQASSDGSTGGPLQDRIGEILLQWMGEKPDGMHRSTIVRPDWRRTGVGIAVRDGRIYFTMDFSR